MKLQRAYNANAIALGVLRDDDGRIFFTSFEHKPIPADTYTVKWCDHPIHGMAWEVQDVPGRTGILIHVGNDADDSEGCICPGYGFAGPSVASSRFAYARLIQFLRKLTTFTLTIADPV